MNKIKVLYVIDFYHSPNAGTENQLYKLIKNLNKQKYEPHLLVFEESDFLRLGNFPCSHTVLGSSCISSPITWFKLAKVTRSFSKQGFKLAHIFFNDPSIICPPVFSLFGLKSIISRRDMGYWYNRKYLTLLNITKYFLSAVTVNSQAVKEVTSKSENILLDKIHVINNGYYIEEDNTKRTINNEITALKNNNKVVVVLVANIRPIKRIQDMVMALADLPPENNNVHFVQIGEGNPEELRALAREVGIIKKCHFLGKKENVDEYIKQADIGVLCSESEGFSNAIVEYQLAAIPVICSNVGGNSEAVTHGKTGLLYECADVRTLSTYIQKLASSPQIRQKMGMLGEVEARRKYDIRNIVAQNEELYLDLIRPR